MGNEHLRRADSSQRFGDDPRRDQASRRVAQVPEATQRLRQSDNYRNISPNLGRTPKYENHGSFTNPGQGYDRQYSPSPVRSTRRNDNFYPRWDLVADASEFANKTLNLVSMTKLNPNMTQLTPAINTSYMAPRVKTAVLNRTLEMDVVTVLSVEEARMKLDSPSVSAGTPRTRTEGSPMMNYLVRARGGRALSNTPSPRSPATSYCEESPHFAGGGRGRGTPSSKGLDSSGGGRSDLCGPGHLLSFGAPVLGGGMAPHLISFGAGHQNQNLPRNPSPHGFSFQGGPHSPSQSSTPPSKGNTSRITKGHQAVIAEVEDEFEEPIRGKASRSSSSSDSIRDVRELVSGSRGKRSVHKSSQGSQNDHRKEESTTAGDYESARRQLLLKVGSSLLSKESTGSRGQQAEQKPVIQSLDGRPKERQTAHQMMPGHQVFSAGMSAEDKGRPIRPMDYGQKMAYPSKQQPSEQTTGIQKLRDIGNMENNPAFKEHMILRKSHTNTNVLHTAKENKAYEDNRYPVKPAPQPAPKYSHRPVNQPTWLSSNQPNSARTGHTNQMWGHSQQANQPHAPIRATHGIVSMPAQEPMKPSPPPQATPRQSSSRGQSGGREPPGSSKGKQPANQGFSIRIDIGTLCNKLTSQMPEFS